MSKADFQKIDEDKDTMSCWGVINHVRYSEGGRELVVDVEGVIRKGPGSNGVLIKRENELGAGSTCLVSLVYEDGSVQRNDFSFFGKGFECKTNHADKDVVDWRGKTPAEGHYKLTDDKVKFEIALKFKDKLIDKMDVNATFEGIIINGFLIEGTCVKDRVAIPEEERKYTDPGRVTITENLKGTSRAIKSQGD